MVSVSDEQYDEAFLLIYLQRKALAKQDSYSSEGTGSGMFTEETQSLLCGLHLIWASKAMWFSEYCLRCSRTIHVHKLFDIEIKSCGKSSEYTVSIHAPYSLKKVALKFLGNSQSWGEQVLLILFFSFSPELSQNGKLQYIFVPPWKTTFT